MLDRLKKTPSQWGWLAAGCAAVMLGAFALLSSSGSGNLALLLLVLCPVMHIVMHRFMHHAGHGNDLSKERPPLALLPAPTDIREPQQRPGRDDG